MVLIDLIILHSVRLYDLSVSKYRDHTHHESNFNSELLPKHTTLSWIARGLINYHYMKSFARPFFHRGHLKNDGSYYLFVRLHLSLKHHENEFSEDILSKIGHLLNYFYPINQRVLYGDTHAPDMFSNNAITLLQLIKHCFCFNNW